MCTSGPEGRVRLGRELWPQVEFVGGGVGGFLVGRQQPGQKALDPADGLGYSVDSVTPIQEQVCPGIRIMSLCAHAFSFSVPPGCRLKCSFSGGNIRGCSVSRLL